MSELGRNNRKIKNFLLKPAQQLKIGVYAIIWSVVATALTLVILYTNLHSIFEIVLELTDLSEEVNETITMYIRDTSFWLGLVLLSYSVGMIFLSIYYTHKFVGPGRAFRRHISDLMAGRYESRVILRKNDAFIDLAEDLNALAAYLEHKVSVSAPKEQTSPEKVS